MADFPLACNFQGDYAMKLLIVDTNDTMDDVVEKAKQALVGVVVKAPKSGDVLRVSRHGEREYLPRHLKVADARFVRMEAVDITVET